MIPTDPDHPDQLMCFSASIEFLLKLSQIEAYSRATRFECTASVTLVAFFTRTESECFNLKLSKLSKWAFEKIIFDII